MAGIETLKRGKYKNKWQRWIVQKGVQTVSKRLGVSYEAVRLWIHGKTVPNDEHKRKIVKMSRGDLGIGDFY